jgi:CRP-like cAMP-binding protein
MAIVDSRILTWPSALVGELMERHPRIAANALEMVGGRTEEMLRRSREFATELVERRIARVRPSITSL